MYRIIDIRYRDDPCIKRDIRYAFRVSCPVKFLVVMKDDIEDLLLKMILRVGERLKPERRMTLYKLKFVLRKPSVFLKDLQIDRGFPEVMKIASLSEKYHIIEI